MKTVTKYQSDDGKEYATQAEAQSRDEANAARERERERIRKEDAEKLAAYEAEAAEELSPLPPELRSAVQQLAYDDAHGSGYSQVLFRIETLVDALRKPLDTFAARIRTESK